MSAIGSAGTLAAAGLASVGQYLQSQLLELFDRGFAQPIAVLLFVIAAIAGLAIVVVGGRTRIGLSLLLGPCLYFAVLEPRVVSQGVEWRFGKTAHNTEGVIKTLTGVYGRPIFEQDKEGKEREVKVSWFFAKWDQITSGITQNLIQLLQVTNIAPDLTFISRTQKFSMLFNLGIVDSEIQKLLHAVFFPKCTAWIELELAKGRSDGLLNPGEIARRSEILEYQTVIHKGDASWTTIEKLNSQGYFGLPAGALQDDYTCRDLWDISITALKTQAYKSIAMVAAEATPDGLSVDELMLEFAAKFGEDGVGTEEDIYLMLNTISSRMLFSALKERLRGFARADYLNPAIRTGEYRPSAEQEDLYDIISAVRDSAAEEADAEQGMVFGLIMALPYIQGILLCILTLAFPFACLLLVYPPRAGHFLVWMSLFLWVKLWDFGFAVVMAIDSLLWTLLPQPPVVSDEALKSAGSAFSALLSGDPSYSISIYWELLSMLLAAVPIITGAIVMRSGKTITQLASSASSQYARSYRENFGAEARVLRDEIAPPGRDAPQTLERPKDITSLAAFNLQEPSVLAPRATPAVQNKAKVDNKKSLALIDAPSDANIEEEEGGGTTLFR